MLVLLFLLWSRQTVGAGIGGGGRQTARGPPTAAVEVRA